MIPLKLTLRGIYSYQTEQTIDFESLTKNHLFGIFGPVGSGKSTILEAISYALYGETERLNVRDGRNYNMMNLKSNELLVDFTFKSGAAGSETYRFTVRGKRDKKDFNTVRTLDRDAYKLDHESWVPLDCGTAEEIIGLSYDNFRRTIIIPQGKFQEFLQLGDADRTKMMKEIFNLDRYDLAARTDVVDRRNSEELENIKGQLIQIGDIDQAMIDVESQKRQELITARHQVEIELAALEKSERAYQDTKELLDKLKKHQVELDKLESRKAYYEQREQLIEEYEVCLKNFPDLLRQRQNLELAMAARSKVIADARKKSDDLARQIQRDEREFDTVKRQFENRHELQTQWEELEAVEAILTIDSELSEIQKKKTTLEKNLQLKKEKLEQSQGRKAHSEATLKHKKKELPDQKTLFQVKSWFEQQKALQGRIGELEDSTAQSHTEISSFENEKKAIFHKAVLNEHTTSTDRQLPLPDFILLLKGKIKECRALATERQDEIDSLKKQEALEQFASELKEGDPCPLCGSSHHPHMYTGKGIKTRITNLKAEKKRADKDAELLQEYVQDLAEINTKVGSLQKVLTKEMTELDMRRTQLDDHNKRFTWTRYKGKTAQWIDKELERASSVAEEIESLEETLEGLRSTIDELNEEIGTGKESLQLFATKSSELNGRRKILRGQIKHFSETEISNLKPTTIKKKIEVLKTALETIEERYNSLERSIRTKKDDYSNTVATIEAEQNLLEQQKKDAEAVNHDLHKRLEATGLKDVKAVEEILGKKLDVKKEKEEVGGYRERLTSARDHHRELEKELGQRKYDEKAHSDLKSKIQSHKQNLRQTNEEIGLRESRIKELNANLQKKTQLDAAKQKLDTRRENLAILKRLFRGGGFVNYASRIYLENLCGIANQRFSQLTRQKLRLELREDNSFQIRDFLNDGRLRSVKTLSGGQTFQASLSLALALVDNLHQFAKSEENFFFLDEGFGTLDKDSLQIVFDALKSLRKENRIVGVISHVEEMQQEIENSIRVRLDTERGSVVELE